jgi:hypothetical protein
LGSWTCVASQKISTILSSRWSDKDVLQFLRTGTGERKVRQLMFGWTAMQKCRIVFERKSLGKKDMPRNTPSMVCYIWARKLEAIGLGMEKNLAKLKPRRTSPL